MIAKHIPMRAKKRSDYGGLVRYLLDPQTKNERVGQVSVTNCQSEDAVVASIEVLNTQSLNQRATGDKTYHLVLSFRTGEQPDARTLSEIESRVCAALGYAEHQRVSVVHHDTDNLHVHVAVNKIHPVRQTMHTPYNDHITLGKICQTLEREFGLQQDNHVGQKQQGENKADDMEQHAGVESLLGWIKRECWNDLQNAQSWAHLHSVLAAHGLRLLEKGNGFVIQSDDGITVKASSLDRKFSRSKLEQRYGTLKADHDATPEPRPGKHYEPRPVGFETDTSALYEQYKAERARLAQDGSRERAFSAAREHKNLLVADAKRSAKLKRNVIKFLNVGRITKKLLYAAVSKSLLSEIGKAQQQYTADRRRIHDNFRRLTWADWLRAQAQRGNGDAMNALRSRKGSRSYGENTLGGLHQQGQKIDGIDSITKHGTVIICAGATVLRDDGAKLTVTREGDQAGLRMALKVAAERYGQCLRVDGTSEFREQIVRAAAGARLNITFDDPALEARRKEFIRTATNQETQHEQANQPEQRRPAGRGISAGGEAASRSNAEYAKPGVGGVGRRPPPQSKDRLRKLSQLGVVRIPSGGAVLLQGDVPGHVEQQRPTADHGMRRPIHRPGGLGDQRPSGRRAKRPKPAALRGSQLPLSLGDSQLSSPAPSTALEDRHSRPTPTPTISKHETSSISSSAKYVFEREQTRMTIADIPKHKVYDGFQGDARFAGLRTVDGQALALLDCGGEIMVAAIDDATARRLKRIPRGGPVMVGKNGAIKSKGRSR